MTTTLPTSTTAASARVLDPEALKILASHKGPCITIAIPDYHPGAPEGTQRAVLKSLLQQVAQEVAGANPADQAQALLAPLEKLTESPLFDAGGQGWVICRAPGFLECYRAHVREQHWSIARNFLLAPYVADALAPDEFLALLLNAKRLRLFEYSKGKTPELPWPLDVPANLETADTGRPDHDLQNHSSTVTGQGAGVRFGTGTERETGRARLHDFFEAVDRALKPLAGERPLVLIGVQEEMAAYERAVKPRAKLFAGEPGNAEFLTATEIGARARKAVLRGHQAAGEAVLTEIREMRDRTRVATDVNEVVRAAAQGRVHRLCVRAQTEPAASTPRGAGLTEAEGPVNTAIAETLRAGGEIFLVAEDRLPPAQPIAAILRY